MARSYEVLLSSIIESLSKETRQEQAEQELPVNYLNLLSEAEKQKLLVDWNTNELNFPQGKCIHELFEEQVANYPDAIALVDESQELSYSELNHRSNQLAHYLIEQGVKPDQLVVLYMERSLEMIIALLGILKAGGAYVPLDPASPEGRLNYMLNDCKASIILTQGNLRNNLPGQQKQNIICLDDETTRSELLSNTQTNVERQAQGLNSEHLAYVIYTSGSTGQPKGVLVNHRSVCDFLFHAVEDFLPEHIVGAVVSSPLVFDATVGSLLVPLCAGKYAELLPEGVFALDRLGDCLADDEESYLFKVTPSHLEAVLSKGYMQKNAQARHVIVVAGEPLKPTSISHWMKELLPASLFINEYGPTETTVGCTTYPIAESFQDMNTTTVPIGRRFGDTASCANINVFEYFNWLQWENENVVVDPEHYLPWNYQKNNVESSL